jgi:2-polyprenyl-3-methyl-5-hydroxy-6-metoxy-1,4-benzoquinol methylase
MDITEFNRTAWNEQSKRGSSWCEPVSKEQIDQARQGHWEVILTPDVKVPKTWLGDLSGKKVLGLASGGGQKMPILAAAGAIISSFDNSDEQLEKDKILADLHDLAITITQGDMADLSVFADEQFDLIFHPVSNCFVSDVDKVWRECFRVLKPGGRLLAGFMNPAMFMFDHDKAQATGQLNVEFSLPYSDLTAPKQRQEETFGKGDAIEFSHSLDSQIGGQIAVGFMIGGFYEDQSESEELLINRYMPIAMATLAIKP